MTGEIHLGWQYATPYADPGPPPRRPVPPERHELSPGWVAAQRQAEDQLDLPLKFAFAIASAALVSVALAGLLDALSAVLAVPAAVVASVVAGLAGNGIWQGKRALRARVAEERRRVAALRADAERRLFAEQAEHAERVRAWQRSRVAYEHQKRWYAVTTPSGVRRVDVAGGTLAGWSALLATSAAFALAEGADVTVLDLTGACAAADLLGYATAAGADVRVWVLPGDLPRLDPVLIPRGRVLADILAEVTAAAAEDAQHRATDRAILDRVVAALGDDANIAGVLAALRVLGQIGDPADDLSAGTLTDEQANRIRVMFGKGAADHVVITRAWTLVSHLRDLEPMIMGQSGPIAPSFPHDHGRLRVVGVDGRAGAVAGRVVGAYVTVALTHALRAEAAGKGYGRIVYLAGAEILHGDVVDRLADACEHAGSRLVLCYRSLPRRARERLGRGDAVLAIMRLGNAEDAKAASDQIGTEQRFVLAQLTETAGHSVSDSSAGSYTSTAGRTDSVSTSRSVSESVSASASTGRSRDGSALPLTRSGESRGTQASESRSTGESDSVSAGLSVSTAWGATTTWTGTTSESAGVTVQRSRELLVEPHELQRLPVSAMIVSYAGPEGREVTLTDVNPGIAALGSSTMLSLAEAHTLPEASPDPGHPAHVPNLGPPPARLDWRRPRH